MTEPLDTLCGDVTPQQPLGDSTALLKKLMFMVASIVLCLCVEHRHDAIGGHGPVLRMLGQDRRKLVLATRFMMDILE